MEFHFSFSKMFCTLLEGKTITAHKNGYIAAGFKPLLVVLRNTHILLYRKTQNVLICLKYVYFTHEQETG